MLSHQHLEASYVVVSPGACGRYPCYARAPGGWDSSPLRLRGASITQRRHRRRMGNGQRVAIVWRCSADVLRAQRGRGRRRRLHTRGSVEEQIGMACGSVVGRGMTRVTGVPGETRRPPSAGSPPALTRGERVPRIRCSERACCVLRYRSLCPVRQPPGTRLVTTILNMRWEHTCIYLFFPGH